MSSQDVSKNFPLVIGNLIPLHVVSNASSDENLVVTLEDEVVYGPPYSHFHADITSRICYIRIRYYNLPIYILPHSIALLLFDVVQIHAFARPGITSNTLCLDMVPITRSAGAVLWSVEIVMQLRFYALYGCSKRIAALNLILFAGSITSFLWITLFNHVKRAASVIHLPLPGCPSVHQGIEWALWVPATIDEGILFSFVLVKTSQSTIRSLRQDTQVSIYALLLRDNIAYFFGCGSLFRRYSTLWFPNRHSR
ncbi:hypothetical protein DFH09DRAFT_1110916 [Mycena vulgaris]|nr:hypothetical protein DFH09DRAFT_1110916 [Mycena vulgaris]